MKIPEFHKKSPLSKNWIANSRDGFSVNVFTGYIEVPGEYSLSSSNWIYPNPVFGKVGCIPMVNNQLFLDTASNPVKIDC